MPDLLKTPARAMRERDLRDTEPSPSPASSNPADHGPFPATHSGADDAAVSREDEANMRRALGMLGGPTRSAQPSGNSERRPSGYNTPNSHASGHSGGHSGTQAAPRRHRFMQDGEVPVTVVRPRTEHASELSRAVPASPINRLDALQESLTAEQAARAVAERGLEEAQATIRTLQTRLSHLELAREEAVALAQQAQAEAQQIQAQAQVEAAAMAAAEVATHGERRPPPDASATRPVAMAAKISRTRAPKQAAPASEPEPEPVKWWLSSQAMRATPARRGRQRTAGPTE